MLAVILSTLQSCCSSLNMLRLRCLKPIMGIIWLWALNLLASETFCPLQLIQHLGMLHTGHWFTTVSSVVPLMSPGWRTILQDHRMCLHITPEPGRCAGLHTLEGTEWTLVYTDSRAALQVLQYIMAYFLLIILRYISWYVLYHAVVGSPSV